MSRLGSPELKKMVLQISVRVSLKPLYPSAAGGCVLLDRFRPNSQIYQRGQKRRIFENLSKPIPYFGKSLPIINGFYFSTETNDFDKIRVRNSPNGSLKRGFNRICLKFPNSLSHIDYILKRN